jgi:hypothetical protein
MPNPGCWFWTWSSFSSGTSASARSYARYACQSVDHKTTVLAAEVFATTIMLKTCPNSRILLTHCCLVLPSSCLGSYASSLATLANLLWREFVILIQGHGCTTRSVCIYLKCRRFGALKNAVTTSYSGCTFAAKSSSEVELLSQSLAGIQNDGSGSIITDMASLWESGALEPTFELASSASIALMISSPPSWWTSTYQRRAWALLWTYPATVWIKVDKVNKQMLWRSIECELEWSRKNPP